MNIHSRLASTCRSAFATVALAAAFCVPTLPAAPAEASGPHGRRVPVERLVEHYIGVYNSHDVTRFSEVHPADYVNHTGLGALTLPELQGLMTALYTAFPDLRYEIVDVVTQGDRVVIEYTYEGTNVAPFLGIPATGQRVYGRGLELHVRRGNALVETFNYSDLFGLFSQLGVCGL